MQPEAKPLFLLIDDQEQGPFDELEVDTMLEEGEITAAHYGFCEGMPGWRSVLEAQIWSRAPLFYQRAAEIRSGVLEIAAGRSSVRDVRAGLRPLLLGDGVTTHWCCEARMDALSAIIQANVSLQHGYRAWSQGTDFSLLDAEPAAEFYAQFTPSIPRDWAAAWTEAGGQIFDGKMIALKTDPVWLALSDFGVPYPAFSVGDGMWVRGTPRGEAEALGLIDADTGLDILPAPQPSWVLLGEP